MILLTLLTYLLTYTDTHGHIDAVSLFHSAFASVATVRKTPVFTEICYPEKKNRNVSL